MNRSTNNRQNVNQFNVVILDCCDGSDEHQNLVSCQNDCAAKQQQFEAETAELRLAFEQGWKKRQEAIEKAKVEKTELNSSLEGKQKEIQAKEQELEQLRVRREAAEQIELDERDESTKQARLNALETLGLNDFGLDELKLIVLDLADQVAMKQKILEVLQTHRRRSSQLVNTRSKLDEEEEEYQKKEKERSEEIQAKEDRINELEKQIEQDGDAADPKLKEELEALEKAADDDADDIDSFRVSPIETLFSSISSIDYVRPGTSVMGQTLPPSLMHGMFC